MNIIWLVILPLLTAFGLGIIKLYWRQGIDLVVFISCTGHLILVIIIAVQALEQPLVYSLGSWDSIVGIHLIVDSLAAFMLLLVSGLSYLVIIYSIKFVTNKKSKYYVLLLLLLAGMSGMIMTADLFNIYVFLEVTSLASYGLIVINKRDLSIEGGFKYLMVSSISGLFILLAIILTYQGVGSLHLAELAANFTSLPSLMQHTILGCYLLGFGAKVALVPLHSWLPDAYTTALAPVSALSSGLIIKVFLYNLIRIIYLLSGLEILKTIHLQSVLVYWGTVTFLAAHLLAYQQTSLRRMLGYSSVAQVGYIIIAFGIGTKSGVIAANYHILNHAVMKGTLFLAAGLFTATTGKYDLKSLTGLGKKMPVAAVGFTTAALAIVGLPPLNGFISKWLIIQAVLEVGYITVGFLIIVGTVLALTYYLRAVRLLYKVEAEEIKTRVCNWQLRIPVIVMGICCLVLGLFPQVSLSVIEETATILEGSYAEFLLGG